MKIITTYDEYMLTVSNNLSIIKFGAEWCGPCKKIKPIFDFLEKEYKDRINFISIDIDENKKIVSYESIKSVPIIFFYNNGEKIDDLTVKGPDILLLKKNINHLINFCPK